jgi:hypothetical protein
MSMPGLAPEPGIRQPRFPWYSGAYERRPIDRITSHHFMVYEADVMLPVEL